jgi:hypothetical protein
MTAVRTVLAIAAAGMLVVGMACAAQGRARSPGDVRVDQRCLKERPAGSKDLTATLRPARPWQACPESARQKVETAFGQVPVSCLPFESTGELLATLRPSPGHAGAYSVPLLIGGEKATPIGETPGETFLLGYDAAWSDDGRQLALTGRLLREGELATVDDQGFNPDQLYVWHRESHALQLAASLPGMVYRVIWSPDSERLVALVAANGDAMVDRVHGDAFLVRLSKRSATRLTTDRNVRSPMWQPKGKCFALADEARPTVLLFSTRGALLCESDVKGAAEGYTPEVNELAWVTRSMILARLGTFDGVQLQDATWHELEVLERACQ